MTQAPNYFSSASRSLFFLYSFSLLNPISSEGLAS